MQGRVCRQSVSTSTMPVSPSDPRVRRVGFCKLQGEGIDFYAQKYIILIGRKSKNANLDVVIGDLNCTLLGFDTGLQDCY